MLMCFSDYFLYLVCHKLSYLVHTNLGCKAYTYAETFHGRQ